MAQTFLVNTHLPQFHILDLPTRYLLKRPPVRTVHLQGDFLHDVPPLPKLNKYSVDGDGHLAPDLLSMRIHPSPMWVSGSFQRDVGTSGEGKPGEYG